MSSTKLSIIVNFYNMRREAKRTLYTLSPRYQRKVEARDYEVIAIDNGSSDPLDADEVMSNGSNFSYLNFQATSPSPCAAINYAVNMARYDNVMVCIDGARMLSPGVIHYTLTGLCLHEHPFIYTLGMHLGHRLQNELVVNDYNREKEDVLLNSVKWRENGYLLFHVSSIASSSFNGYFSKLSESNCFALRKTDYLFLGGLDERFTSAGGGIVNLDFFNLVHEDEKMYPVMLLGEASFHQFHGGVATNVPLKQHPWEKMAEEYYRIKGKPFDTVWRQPDYYGWLSSEYHTKLV